MTPLENPFTVVKREIAAVRETARVVLVDFHGEATSEKIAMGWHLDGEVTAVVGTHTHVQTADERLLPNGTAYITDVGMTGPHDSVLGVEKAVVLRRFLTALPGRFDTARGDPRLNGVLVTADAATGRATAIERLSLTPADLEAPPAPGAPVSTNPTLPFDAAPPGRRPARQVVTVSELTGRIRTLLESTHANVWVEGEIANCRLWKKTGHLYFTLRDENAQLKAVMFRSAARYLRFAPEDGLRVVARGRVTVYDPKGEYQIVCEHLQPQGLGALQLAFDQLKRKLETEGLFARERKRPLPVLPRGRSAW